MPDWMSEFLNAIRDERARQDRKWGEQDHSPEIWLAILLEEVGESAKATLEGQRDELLKELVQVAAVACAFYENVQRNGTEFPDVARLQRTVNRLREHVENWREIEHGLNAIDQITAE